MTVCGCGCRCRTSCTSWHLKTVCTSRRYLCRQETLLPTLPLHYLSAMDSNLIAVGLRVKFWSRKTGIRIIEQRRLSLCNKVVVRLKSSRAKQSWVLTHKPHNHMTQHSRQSSKQRELLDVVLSQFDAVVHCKNSEFSWSFHSSVVASAMFNVGVQMLSAGDPMLPSLAPLVAAAPSFYSASQTLPRPRHRLPGDTVSQGEDRGFIILSISYRQSKIETEQ